MWGSGRFRSDLQTEFAEQVGVVLGVDSEQDGHGMATNIVEDQPVRPVAVENGVEHPGAQQHVVAPAIAVALGSVWRADEQLDLAEIEMNFRLQVDQPVDGLAVKLLESLDDVGGVVVEQSHDNFLSLSYVRRSGTIVIIYTT